MSETPAADAAVDTVPLLALAVCGPFLFDSTSGMQIASEAAPTFDEWQECGRWLRELERRVQFYLGDWINYGRDRWGEAAEQGVLTAREHEAAEAAGWKPATLDQYARVARQVPPERRDPDLSFGHHREVADKPAAEQGEWLGRAKRNNWSVDTLRRELKRADQPEAPQACWLIVRCATPEDRDALVQRMQAEGREVKLS